MKKDIYQVVEGISGRSLGFYSAETGGQAKRAVVAEMKANKLSGAEIYEVHKNGYGVCDVIEGRIVLNLEESDDARLALPLGDETQAP